MHHYPASKRCFNTTDLECSRPGQCKTQMEMGAQPLQLEGELQQGSSCPGSGSEQRQCFIPFRVNISPGNQINRKRLCFLPYLTLGMVQSYTASLTILFNYLTLREVERITGGQVSQRRRTDIQRCLLDQRRVRNSFIFQQLQFDMTCTTLLKCVLLSAGTYSSW